MFREIRRSEKITNTCSTQVLHEGFKEIKPETNMTKSDAMDFFNSLFSSIGEKKEA